MITGKYFGRTLEFRSPAAVLHWLSQNTQQAGWKRSVENYYLTAPKDHGHYWLRSNSCLELSKEDYALVYRLSQRYKRFCRHMEEVDPEWEAREKTHWADNSVEVTEHSRKYPGMTRRVQLAAPSGDACF